MLVTQKRPRNLAWYHSGPLLFGDWGTSRLYVLGLAFFYTGHASVFYLALMSILMALVAWAYTIICRCFPEGGGVYTAARQLSPLLSVIGATLLLGGYVITASLSTLEAFHYFGCPEGRGGWLIGGVSIATILLLGAVNWLGARTAGHLALVIAIAAISVSLVLAVAVLPLIPEGIRTIGTGPAQGPWMRWENFVHIVLALSGIEAVANLTGLFKEPVERTSRLTIWPVLFEVAIFNLVFGLALTGLPALRQIITPDALTYAADQVPRHVAEYRDTALEVLAVHATTPWFGKIAAIVFGLLLLSASNTAVVAIVSVLYSMAQDKELPHRLTRLNYSGVPWLSLVAACVLPSLVLVVERDVAGLASLYAVGVCGAITINIFSCVANKKLSIKVWERRGMLAIGVILGAIGLTIIVTKPNATIFAGGLVAVVLGLRFARKTAHAMEGRIPEPETGWLAEVEGRAIQYDPDKPRIMLAARGRNQAEFAVDFARRRRATLFVIYVRTLRIMDLPPGVVPHIKDDPEALESLGSAALIARRANVPFVPIYVCSPDIAEEILDYTVTFGCDTLIMGKTRRIAFARAVEGDVVAKVAQHLPDGVALITRENSPHPGVGAKP